MKINLALSDIANVLAVVNDTNQASNLNLTADQVTFGTVQTVAGTAGRNSEITLTGVNGKGVEGSRTFAYTRQSLDAGAVASTAPTEVIVQDGDNAATVMGKVVTALGLLPGQVESSDFVAPADVDTNGSITLNALSDSLVYVGSRAVVVKLPDTDVAFATLAPETDLNGFEAEA